MPNRILRESICTSDTIDRLTWFEEALYYRLIVSCDDFGRFDGRTAVIKNRLFPLKDNLTLKTVETALHGLVSAGLVVLYMVEDRRFLYLPTWGKYQTQRAKVSKYPSPNEQSQTHEIICKQTQADDSKCPRIRESNSYSYSGIENREAGVDNARAARFTPPTVDEVRNYCKERQNGVDAERFVDFYESKGWLVGKSKMKDWRAAVRNWERGENRGAAKRTDGDQAAAGNWGIDAIVL